MPASIAGATSSGPRMASAASVTQSSAMPCAMRASTDAVAGVTSMRSASRPSATCGSACSPSGAQMSVSGSWPVTPRNVAGPTNSVAARVITVRTAAPACTRRLATSADL